MDAIDQRRLGFIGTLYNMSEQGRAHLLAVESDVELVDLQRVALEQQHFEMAVCIRSEVRRRKTEIPV